MRKVGMDDFMPKLGGKDRLFVEMKMPTEVQKAITESIRAEDGEYVLNIELFKVKRFAWVDGGTRSVYVHFSKKNGSWYVLWPTAGVVANLKRDINVRFNRVFLKYIPQRNSLPEWVKDELLVDSVLEVL